MILDRLARLVARIFPGGCLPSKAAIARSVARATDMRMRFRRLWELYLSYCEGGFAARRIGDVQILLAKPSPQRETAARG